MTLAFKLYEQVNEAPDDRTRFRLIVDAIRELEEGWPRPGEIARGADVRESELRLQKEIEVVRKEMKEVELRLQKEIAQVRVDLEQVRVDLKSTEANLRTAMHRQTVWIIGAIGAVTGLVKLLDWLLA